MKHFYCLTLLLIAALASSISHADPEYQEGQVQVLLAGSPAYPAGLTNLAIGQFNVRYNLDAEGDPYIGAIGLAGYSVHFFARDSQGEQLQCAVAPGDNLYEAAVDIRNSLSNGSRLAFHTAPNGTKCLAVYHGKYSSSLD